LKERKSQNSIFVLATLGVYLGLVFAGATPGVLAQAAMAKQFDVKDEINKTDGLEKKPDDEKRSPLTTSVQIYIEDVEYFLASLSRLAAQGKFDAKRDTFNVVQTTMLPCVAASVAGRYTPVRFETSNEALRSPLNFFSRGMLYGYSLGDCVANGEFNGTEAVDSRFDLKLDEKGFKVWLEVKKGSDKEAEDLKRSLDSTLALYSTTANTALRKSVLKHTRFGFRSQQSILSFHLARSDLDSLLASNAK